MLKEGQIAPNFNLPDYTGEKHQLSDFRGQKIVLYFYPHDNTLGCTNEALAFKSAFEAFCERGIVIIGISKDNLASHRRFREKYELPFLLLSDTELDAIRAYDVWQLKMLYGNTSYGMVRTTYVIDENGVIEKVYEKVKPDKNAKEILRFLDDQKSDALDSPLMNTFK